MPASTPRFGDFAPGLVHYTDQVLFDEVWEREGLSKRDRSLVTIAGPRASAVARKDWSCPPSWPRDQEPPRTPPQIRLLDQLLLAHPALFTGSGSLLDTPDRVGQCL